MDDDDRATVDAVKDELTTLKAGQEQLRAEFRWMKAIVLGERLAEVEAKTRPPVLVPIGVAVIGTLGTIVGAYIATRP